MVGLGWEPPPRSPGGGTGKEHGAGHGPVVPCLVEEEVVKGSADAICGGQWEPWRGGRKPRAGGSQGVGSSGVLPGLFWALPSPRGGSWVKGGCKRAQSWGGDLELCEEV